MKKINAKACMALCMGLLLAGVAISSEAQAKQVVKCYTEQGYGVKCFIIDV